MNLENIRLSESSLSQKTPFHINVQNRQTHRDRKYSSCCQGLGWGAGNGTIREKTAKGYGVSSWGDDNALKVDCGNGFTILLIYEKPVSNSVNK